MKMLGARDSEPEMETYKPTTGLAGPAAPAPQRTPPPDAPPSLPRRDLPPVGKAGGTDATAPRPPSLSQLGMVRAGLLAPLGADTAPERALKPWGVAMLPDAAWQAEQDAARRDAEARHAEAAAADAALARITAEKPVPAQSAEAADQVKAVAADPPPDVSAARLGPAEMASAGRTAPPASADAAEPVTEAAS